MSERVREANGGSGVSAAAELPEPGRPPEARCAVMSAPACNPAAAARRDAAAASAAGRSAASAASGISAPEALRFRRRSRPTISMALGLAGSLRIKPFRSRDDRSLCMVDVDLTFSSSQSSRTVGGYPFSRAVFVIKSRTRCSLSVKFISSVGSAFLPICRSSSYNKPVPQIHRGGLSLCLFPVSSGLHFRAAVFFLFLSDCLFRAAVFSCFFRNISVEQLFSVFSELLLLSLFLASCFLCSL